MPNRTIGVERKFVPVIVMVVVWKLYAWTGEMEVSMGGTGVAVGVFVNVGEDVKVKVGVCVDVAVGIDVFVDVGVGVVVGV